VPFTQLVDLPRSSVTVDNAQPFPVIGWLQLKWVYEGLTVGSVEAAQFSLFPGDRTTSAQYRSVRARSDLEDSFGCQPFRLFTEQALIMLKWLIHRPTKGRWSEPHQMCHSNDMPVFEEGAFARGAFPDLDTLTDSELHNLNRELVRANDNARAEQWRARIADILVSRL
jgi:hypothetical protein